jgi:hypothetical protein
VGGSNVESVGKGAFDPREPGEVRPLRPEDKEVVEDCRSLTD